MSNGSPDGNLYRSHPLGPQVPKFGSASGEIRNQSQCYEPGLSGQVLELEAWFQTSSQTREPEYLGSRKQIVDSMSPGLLEQELT